jgi:transcriptional regulator with XRE-family HTH domain
MATHALDGEQIKKLLDKKGWSQHTLADKIGISRRQMERLLNGHSRTSAEVRDSIAALLGASVEAITLPKGVAAAAGAIPRSNPKLFGRTALLAELVQRLRAFAAGEAGPHVLSLQGMPGLGKTALATAVAYESQRGSFPDGIFWQTLGKKANPLAILTRWCADLGVGGLLDGVLSRQGAEDESVIAKEAGERFRAYLLAERKRILFILDDAWAFDDAWGVWRVRPLTIDGGLCATLITTRLLKLVESLDVPPGNRKQPSLLGEEDALQVLRDRAGKEVIDRNMDTCRDLVQKLGGLPLALVVAANMIRRSVSHGRAVAELIADLQRRTDQLLREPAPQDVQQFLHDVENPNVVALLQMSTDALDDESFQCFALLGNVTPSEDVTFDLDRMAHGWKSVLGERSEERAQAIADTLIDNGLMQPAEPLFGKTRYSMHDLLIQHAKTLVESGE